MQILRRPADRKFTLMFRNVRYYRLDFDWPDGEEALAKELEVASFQPCGPLTERSSGWVPVSPDANELLARRLNGADLMKLRSQSRLLPPAAINEALETRIEEFRNRMQEEPGPRERRRLKAETRDELLPKAMLKSDRIRGYVDLKEKVIGIDSAQASVAERFLQRLRASFADLTIRPLQFRQPINELLTGIFLGGAPKQFVLGRECHMQDAIEAKSVVRWTDSDLTEKSIRNHIANGMRLTHLAIEYDNVMACMLDENGVISKLRFLGMDDDADSTGIDDRLTRQDAEFVLMSGTLRLLLGDLKKLLGGFA